MKICLINPPSLHRYFDTIVRASPSPTLAYLGGYLSNTDHQVTLVDSKLEGLKLDEAANIIGQTKPDLVGLTTCTADLPISRSLARMIKSVNSGTKVVIGGAHPTALPERTLREEQWIDAAVVGEGEATLLDLANAIESKADLRDVKGCAFRRGDEVIITPPRDPIDLNKTPIPAWGLMRSEKKYYVQVSRGCPGKCSFCYPMFGKRVRTVSPEKIIAEIEHILSLANPDEFILGAATFGIPRDHSMQVLNALISSGINKKIKWRTITRVDIPDREMYALMKTAGCYQVGLGIESGDNRILRQTGKYTRVDRIKECMATIRSVGLDTVGFFVFGHPTETKESLRRTSDFAVDLNPTHLTIGIMTPWPGTEVHRLAIAGKAGYRLSNRSIEGSNKHFGPRVLLFENFSIFYLQWLRLRTYFLLYWKNARLKDGFRFFKNHLTEGLRFFLEMILSPFRRD